MLCNNKILIKITEWKYKNETEIAESVEVKKLFVIVLCFYQLQYKAEAVKKKHKNVKKAEATIKSHESE